MKEKVKKVEKVLAIGYNNVINDKEIRHLENGNFPDNEIKERLSETNDCGKEVQSEVDCGASEADYCACPVIEPQLSDEQLEKEARIKSMRRPLVFSLVGLFFAPFFGAGIVFSVVALVLALKKTGEGKSVSISWAITISIVGIAINALVFVLLLSYYYNHPPVADPLPVEFGV